jgi:hypothetical protein
MGDLETMVHTTKKELFIENKSFPKGKKCNEFKYAVSIEDR